MRERNLGHLRPPSPDDVRRLGDEHFLGLTERESASLAAAAAGMLELLDTVEEMPGPDLPLLASRDRGRASGPEDDPFNAFVRVLSIAGAVNGPLAGRAVAIKDSIAIAGVPMSNGSRTYAATPDHDAVVVERILAAGGTIVGTTNLDDFSGSGLGVTSVHGPPRNPLDPRRSCGGSSGGSAAAVAGGLADLALGVDGGGSVRMPAAQCGLVGVKATHGLVPTFGLASMDHTLDAIGPIARDVRGAALLLSVIAGEDWRDPQWARGVQVEDYVDGVGETAEGLRVGVIEEALDPALCQPAVLAGVGAAADALAASGAAVERVSIPEWRAGFAIWLGILLGGLPATLRANGVPYGSHGLVDVGRVHAAGLVRRLEAGLLPPTLKIALLLHAHLDERYHQVPLARAQNQRVLLRRLLETVLGRYDVLLAPTTPRVAAVLPEGRLTDEEAMALMVSETVHAAPLNATGHPAVAVPSGRDGDGMPTSVQVIAGLWRERIALRAAAAIESALALDLHPGR